MSIAFNELRISEGAKRDWPHFAQWHYRSQTLGPVKRVTLLCQGEKRIGICVFGSPAAQLKLRNEFFGFRWARGSRVLWKTGMSPGADRLTLPATGFGEAQAAFLKDLNRQLWVLSRIVIDPAHRGQHLAVPFIRESCRTCPIPWIECLTVLGHTNPLLEKAGFLRVGVCRKKWVRHEFEDPEQQSSRATGCRPSESMPGEQATDGRQPVPPSTISYIPAQKLPRVLRRHEGMYGRHGALSTETLRKSLVGEPVYYVFDNRNNEAREPEMGHGREPRD